MFGVHSTCGDERKDNPATEEEEMVSKTVCRERFINNINNVHNV